MKKLTNLKYISEHPEEYGELSGQIKDEWFSGKKKVTENTELKNKMKAINTEYKGHFFRSRLEAKWAVYFDMLGVKWEYEPEGFEKDGIRYLPDFYFPEYDIWAEIKPTGHGNKDLPKWEMLSQEKILIVFEGIPHAGICKVYGFIDYQMDIIPFACKLNDSYGMMWHATNNEDWSEIEPYKTAIKTANYKRFDGRTQKFS